MKRYKIWTDSESAKELPNTMETEYNDPDVAYNVMVDFVHSFDGEPFRVIAHIEDMVLYETIETIENFTKE